MEKKLSEMKASELHRILAKVLEIAETSGFCAPVDANIKESSKPNRWKMTFFKERTDIDELAGIKADLGKNFSIIIEPKDKGRMLITIEASSEDFYSLLVKDTENSSLVKNHD